MSPASCRFVVLGGACVGVEFVKAKPMIAGLSLELLAGGVGVAIVVALGKWLAKRQEAAAATQRPAEISK